MRERKYSSGCQCGICPSQTDKLCAQQTASLLSEKPGGFFDSLRPPERAVSFCGNPRTSFLQTNTPYPASIPPPFRQGRVWEVRTAGRCRHRPLRNSIENPCVGADAYIGPVAPIFKSCVGRRALTPPRWRSEYRTAGWGQPALQCLAPLPKGGLGGRIATASVRTDLAMTGFPWSVVFIGRHAALRRGYKRCGKTGRRGRRPLRRVTRGAVGRVTARAAPTPNLSALHFSPSRLFDIVNDDFRPPCGRFGHPANF